MTKKRNGEPNSLKRLDKWAVDLGNGFVKVEGIQTPVKKEEYLHRRDNQLLQMKLKEGKMKEQVRCFILSHLPFRTGQFQEEIRKFSWSWQQDGDPTPFKVLLRRFPKGIKIGHPGQSLTSLHHKQHLVFAFFAALQGLPQVLSGESPLRFEYAEDEDEALHGLILMWETLLEMKPLPERSRSHLKSNPLDQINAKLDLLLKAMGLSLEERSQDEKALRDCGSIGSDTQEPNDLFKRGKSGSGGQKVNRSGRS